MSSAPVIRQAPSNTAARSPSANVIAVLRLLIVILPPSLLSALPWNHSLDAFHYFLVELSIIALFRTLLGLPDPSRALRILSAPTTSAPVLVTASDPATANVSCPSASTSNSDSVVLDQLGSTRILKDLDKGGHHEPQGDGPTILPHPHLALVDPLVQRFLALTKMDDAAIDSRNWELVVDRGDAVKIWRSRHNQHQYRLLGVFDAPLYTTFDFLNDIEQRPTWDEMTESTRILQVLSPTTRIQHMQIKAIWPTSARDLCLLSHWRRLSDTQILACTMSVDHPLAPVQPNVVRMDADCAGQICELVVVNGVEKTRVLQVADGDPKGWVPNSILTFVATKALPNSFIKINELVSKMQPIDKSRFLVNSSPTMDSTPSNITNDPLFRHSKPRSSHLSPSEKENPMKPPSLALPQIAAIPTTSPSSSTPTASTATTAVAGTSIATNTSRLFSSWWRLNIWRNIHRTITTLSPYAVTAILAMMVLQRSRAPGSGSIFAFILRRIGGGDVAGGKV